jgi:hypothetical protein
MKITNYALLSIMNILEIYESKKLPQKISYAITRNIMNVSKEYSIYDKQLNSIFNNYKGHMIKDDNGEIKTNSIGVPLVDDSVKSEFEKQISDLLNFEINLEAYHIDLEAFDYDDQPTYDVLSAKDIMVLQSILCDPSKNEQGS